MRQLARIRPVSWGVSKMKSVRAGWRGSIALLVVPLAFLIASCSAKKPPPGAGEGSSLGQGGLASGGSLDRFKSGMQPGEGGPLADVHFDYDRYDLGDQERATLQQNANWLKQNPAAKVEIEGHCDDRGTVEYNLALGAKRAKAVKDYLVTLGIPSDRLSTISYGEELPLCHEENESCWQKNRRAHSVVLQ
jgi:peptidoglycan-associated lipoprotein